MNEIASDHLPDRTRLYELEDGTCARVDVLRHDPNGEESRRSIVLKFVVCVCDDRGEPCCRVEGGQLTCDHDDGLPHRKALPHELTIPHHQIAAEGPDWLEAKVEDAIARSVEDFARLRGGVARMQEMGL